MLSYTGPPVKEFLFIWVTDMSKHINNQNVNILLIPKWHNFFYVE